MEDEFIDQMHSLVLDERTLPVVLEEYDRLEAETARKLQAIGSVEAIIDLRRNVAAAKLSAALDKLAGMETAAEVFGRSNELGCESPEKKLVAAAIFARICLRNGRRDLAESALDEALKSASVPAKEYEAFKALLGQLRRAP